MSRRKCCCGTCGACLSGNAPAELTVVLSGFTNSGACNGCANAIGSWVVPFNACFGAAGSYAAIWGFQNFPAVDICSTYLGSPCLGLALSVEVDWNSNTNVRTVIVQMQFNTGACSLIEANWTLTQTLAAPPYQPFSCTSLSALGNIPISVGPNYCSNDTCSILT